MTEKTVRRLPDGSLTTDVDHYCRTWQELGDAVAKFFQGYRLSAYDPGICLDNNAETLRFSVPQAMLLLQTIDAANAEIKALRAEVCKQVFGSRVVFDRAVVERAQKEEDK